LSAAQFTGTNGRTDRRLHVWRFRAISSFPVPLSPVTRTFDDVSARRRMLSQRSQVAADDPMIGGSSRVRKVSNDLAVR
jgi:hypothetical protein